MLFNLSRLAIPRRRVDLAFTAAVALCVLAFSSPAQAVTRQTIEHAAVPGSYSYQFLRYLPPHYGDNPSVQWPLMIMLHGAGEVGTNAELLALNGPPMLIERGRDYPAVVISPQATTRYWDPRALAAFIDDLLATYHIDPARIYITGLSLGGYGTWALAEAYPERYAAIVPICGGGDPSQAAKLRDIPIWVFHGDADRTVPLWESQRMVDAIRAAGGNPKFTIYPGVGHDSWVPAYTTEELYTWMFAQTLATTPVPPTPTTPTITAQPQGHVVGAGDTAVLRVEASGGDLTYQWKKDGVPIPNATSQHLILQAVQASDSGAYSVTVTNIAGSATSQTATLTCLSTEDHGRLINLSVRTTAGVGDQSLIVGFVTTGAGNASSSYLVQGLGPRLAAYSVPDLLANPVMEILSAGNSAPVAANDDWAGDSAIAAKMTEVGATPLSDITSKDAALLVNLPRGIYSIKVTGKNNTTGTTLASVYDAAPTNVSASKPQLVNLSARAQTDNNNPLIAGFVISGRTAKTLLIRGLGPYLSSHVGAAALSDPKIELHQQDAGTSRLLLSNDDWGGAAQVGALAQNAGAQPLANDSKDAALLVTLDPGVYSVVVKGVNAASGIALIELYIIP
jgi:hypothetical protein